MRSHIIERYSFPKFGIQTYLIKDLKDDADVDFDNIPVISILKSICE